MRWRPPPATRPASAPPRWRPPARGKPSRGGPWPAPPRRGRSGGADPLGEPPLLAKTMVERCAADELEHRGRWPPTSTGGWRAVSGRAGRRCRREWCSPQAPAQRCGHVLDRDHQLDLEIVLSRDIDHPDRSRHPIAPRPRSLRRGSGRWSRVGAAWRKARAAGGRPGQLLETFQRDGEVGPSLGTGDGVDLVDDHPANRLEDAAGGRGEDEEERFGVVMRMSGGWRCILLRSSAGVSPVRMPAITCDGGGIRAGWRRARSRRVVP